MKTVTACRFTRDAIERLIANHIKAVGDERVMHVFQKEGDEWVVEHGAKVCEVGSLKDGLSIHRVTRLTPGEVNKILTDECRSVLQIKQCSSSVEYLLTEQSDDVTGALVTINSQEP